MKEGDSTHLAEYLKQKQKQKHVTISSLREDMEKLELLYIAGGNRKWRNYIRKKFC